jgi:hypothetical protein
VVEKQADCSYRIYTHKGDFMKKNLILPLALLCPFMATSLRGAEKAQEQEQQKAVAAVAALVAASKTTPPSLTPAVLAAPAQTAPAAAQPAGPITASTSSSSIWSWLNPSTYWPFASSSLAASDSAKASSDRPAALASNAPASPAQTVAALAAPSAEKKA